MIKISKLEMDLITHKAFIDELEKHAGWAAIARVAKKMFGKGARKKMMAYGRSSSLRADKITKKRGRKRRPGSKLNFAQKSLGRIMYRGRQAVKNPIKFLKDDWASNVKYMQRSPNRVIKSKKGDYYKTIFGNKRKVVGYSGGNALIKKRVGGKVLGAAVSVPGLTAMSYAGRPKRDKKGRPISKGKRGAKSVAEGAAWRIAPIPMLAKELATMKS